MKFINLLPTERSSPPLPARRIPTAWRGRILVAGTFVVWVLVSRVHLAILDARLAQQARDVEKLALSEQNLETAEAEWQQLSDKALQLESIKSPVSLKAFLAMVSHAVPDGVTALDLTLEIPAVPRHTTSSAPGKRAQDDARSHALLVNLRGYAPDHSAVADVARAFGEFHVTDVTIDQCKDIETETGDAIEFRMSFRIVPPESQRLAVSGVPTS